MTPAPLPYPDPSEAPERSLLLPTSPPLPLKKDDIEPAISLMYMESPADVWNLSVRGAAYDLLALEV